jgi:hypothetical protein
VRLPYTHTRLPNGIVSDYTYDQLNRLEDLTQFRDADDDGIFDAGEDLVAQYDYNLLANGRRSGVAETDDNANTTQIDWLYDDLGRLTREVYDSSADRSSGDTIRNYLRAGFFGPGFWRRRMRPNFFSRRFWKASSPRGRPVLSCSRNALICSSVAALTSRRHQFFANANQ